MISFSRSTRLSFGRLLRRRRTLAWWRRTAAEDRELVRRARILAFLIGRGAIARLGRGGIARCQRGAGRGRELTGELLDEVLLVHATRFAPAARGSKFLRARAAQATAIVDGVLAAERIECIA